jgi:hypothetical protein
VSDHSRRVFLQRASVGAAAVGVVAVAPAFTTGASAQGLESAPDSTAPAHEGSFVVWIKDPKAGQLAVLVGEKELVFTDKKLAKQLAQAAARAQRS